MGHICRRTEKRRGQVINASSYRRWSDDDGDDDGGGGGGACNATDAVT